MKLLNISHDRGQAANKLAAFGPIYRVKPINYIKIKVYIIKLSLVRLLIDLMSKYI